jgi:hypothetical protein
MFAQPLTAKAVFVSTSPDCVKPNDPFPWAAIIPKFRSFQ